MKKVLLTLVMVAGFAVTANAQCAENETYVEFNCGWACAYYENGTMSGFLGIDAMNYVKRALTFREYLEVKADLNLLCGTGPKPSKSLDSGN
jgi:hypothetical protein